MRKMTTDTINHLALIACFIIPQEMDVAKKGIQKTYVYLATFELEQCGWRKALLLSLHGSFCNFFWHETWILT